MEFLDVTQTHCVVTPSRDEIAVILLQRLHQINQHIIQINKLLEQPACVSVTHDLVEIAQSVDQLFFDNNTFQSQSIRMLNDSERETVVTITQDLLIKFQPQIHAIKKLHQQFFADEELAPFHTLQQALLVNLSSTVLLRAIEVENLDHQLDVFNKLFRSKDFTNGNLIEALTPALQVFTDELSHALNQQEQIALHIQSMKKTMLETDQLSLFQTVKHRFENTYLVTLTLIKLHLQNEKAIGNQVIARFKQLIETFIVLCNKNYELIKHKEKSLKHRMALQKSHRESQSTFDLLEAQFNAIPYAETIETIDDLVPCVEQHKKCFVDLSAQYDLLIQHLPRASLDSMIQDALTRCEDLYIDLIESFSEITAKAYVLAAHYSSISPQLCIRKATQQLRVLNEKRDCASLLGVIQDCESANESFDFDEGDPYEKMSIVEIGESLKFLNAAVKLQASTLRDETESPTTPHSLTAKLRKIIRRFEKPQSRFAPQQIEELLQRQKAYSRQLHRAHDHIEKMIVAVQTKALVIHPNDLQRLRSYKAQSQLIYSQLLQVQPALNQLKNSQRHDDSTALRFHPKQSELLLVCSHPLG